jgi:hypothetical protein
MARPLAEHPQKVLISYRVTEDVAALLDREIADEARPGEILSQHDMARILMNEALAVRTAERKVKGKKS